VLAAITLLWAVPQIMHPPVRAEDEEAGGEKAATVQLTPADVVVVSSQPLAEVLRASGTLEPLPNGRATVSAEVAGRLVDLSLKPGDPVRAGQELARMYRTDLGAEVEKADAAVEEARREVSALERQVPLQAET